MSLLGHVHLLSDQRIAALLAQPALVYAVVDGAYNDPASGFVDLDKAWHCLHYLLTGSAGAGEPPLDFLLKGGSPVGDEDVGNGPARVLLAAEVATLAAALAPIDSQRLLLRFDLQTLDALDIYPGGWLEMDLTSDYELGYFLGPYQELKRLLARAVSEKLGLIIWLA
jgi:hypothetical protein